LKVFLPGLGQFSENIDPQRFNNIILFVDYTMVWIFAPGRQKSSLYLINRLLRIIADKLIQEVWRLSSALS